MRLYDEPPPSSAALAPGSRVPTAALTHALAEIEARRARQAFEQAGTVTLAEALSESGVEATPEELAEEVWRAREADAAQAAKQKRRRRLRLILRAELVSSFLCALTLLCLSRTGHGPQQLAQSQGERVQDILALTEGPAPRYTLSVVPAPFYQMSSGPTYPLTMLPDGCNIHCGGGLDLERAYFELRSVEQYPGPGDVWVFYNGLCYRRGWVRTSDVPNVLHGRPFQYYPEPVDDPQDHHAGLTPLTLSDRSIAEASHELTQAHDASYNLFAFKAGVPVQLDEHAWESF